MNSSSTVSLFPAKADLADPARTSRIASMARIRILAAFGVVWFHMGSITGREFGCAGLPIFLLVSFSLISAYSFSRPYDIKQFIAKRAIRLLVPWFVWSGVYAFFKYAHSIRKGESYLSELGFNNLAMGTNLHLWYLPYAFVAAIAVYKLTFRTRNISQVLVILLSSLIGAVLIFCGSVVITEISLPNPHVQWIFSLGAVPIGFALGRTCGIANLIQRYILFCIIAVLTLGSCVGLHLLGFSQMVIPYSVAIIMVCFAHVWHGRFDRFTQFMDRMTFGIYLIHPLISRFLFLFLDFSRILWVGAISTFIFSTLVVYVLQKTPLKRFV